MTETDLAHQLIGAHRRANGPEFKEVLIGTLTWPGCLGPHRVLSIKGYGVVTDFVTSNGSAWVIARACPQEARFSASGEEP